MTYLAHVKHGEIVLDEPVALPEGSAVSISLLPASKALPEANDEECPTLYEQFKDIIGIAEGLPTDFAVNHDHYIHGAPKR